MCYDNTPDYLRVVKPNFSWPIIRLVVFSHFRLRVLQISLHIRQAQPRGWEKKNKRINTVLGQLQAQEREVCVTPFCSFLCICRRSRVCILRETPTKPVGMITHLWLSSLTASFCWPTFPWTAILCRPSSSALLYQMTLSSLGPSFPPALPISREISSLVLRVGFAPKQTKRSSEWRQHKRKRITAHRVTVYSTSNLQKKHKLGIFSYRWYF